MMHLKTTVLAAAGIPGANYSAIEAVVYPLLEGANSSLLTNLLVRAGHSSLCLLRLCCDPLLRLC